MRRMQRCCGQPSQCAVLAQVPARRTHCRDRGGARVVGHMRSLLFRRMGVAPTGTDPSHHRKKSQRPRNSLGIWAAQMGLSM
jgi:hypothetical protein